MPQTVTDNLPCSQDAHRQLWSCLITTGRRTKPQVDCTLPTGTCATGTGGGLTLMCFRIGLGSNMGTAYYAYRLSQWPHRSPNHEEVL